MLGLSRLNPIRDPFHIPICSSILFINSLLFHAFIYVAFAFLMIARSTVETCRARAALYDENDWVIVGLVVGSAAASFAAIFAELAAIKSGEAPVAISLVMTGITVMLAWTFTHVIFTLHYANLYYRPRKGGVPGGLDFPGDEPPDYRDFLYYAFVIGCAAQTADVATTSRDMRSVVTSFFASHT